MIKIKLIFVTVLLLFVSGCGGPYTSMSPTVKVEEKGHSEDFKELWVIASNPNNEKDPKIKIIIREANVWNLMQVNHEYFTAISKEGDNPWVLEQIGHPGDENLIIP